MGHDPQEPQQENICMWFEQSLGRACYLGEPAELRKEQEGKNFFLLPVVSLWWSTGCTTVMRACTTEAALEDVLAIHERKASSLLFLLLSCQLRAIITPG